jgi:hypothetical protein
MRHTIADPPAICDFCDTPLIDRAYDCAVHAPSGRTIWAWVCRDCFIFFKCKLGSGYGQEYTKIRDCFVKTRG